MASQPWEKGGSVTMVKNQLGVRDAMASRSNSSAQNAEVESAVNELMFIHPEGDTAYVQVLRVSELRKRKMPFSIYDPARHEFHTIQVITRGTGYHWVDFERLKVGRGDILYTRPGQVRTFDRASRHEALYLLFRSEALHTPELLQQVDPGRQPTIRLTAPDFELISNLVMSLKSLERRRPSFDVHQLSPWILGAIVAAVGEIAKAQHGQRSSSPSHYMELVHKFEMVLEKQFTSQRIISWYADELSVTGRNLARACTAVRNRTPKQLLNTRVTVEAKRQLIMSRDSVERIAANLGFTESTNFVKFFRKNSGQTPNEFRRRITLG